MKEHSLNPGDVIGKWTVDHHIANGCIYGVKCERDSQLYALKLREQKHKRRFQHELDVLKKINELGGHPSFQQLYDYNPNQLWMVITYVDPKNAFEKLIEHPYEHETIAALDLNEFANKMEEAFVFALGRGVWLNTSDTDIFIKDGYPFFVDIEFCGNMASWRSNKQMVLERLCCNCSPNEAFLNLRSFNTILASID